jgi:hypothetical protein
MKKLLTLIFFFICLNGFSQSFELGTGFDLYRLNGTYTDVHKTPYLVNQLNMAFNFLGSGNFPIKKIKEEFYIGVNPNASVGYGSGMFIFDMPAYFTLKYGLASHRDSGKPFGLGVGVGGQFSGFTMNTSAGPLSATYLVPSVMAQVAFVIPNYRAYQIRADITPVPAEKIKGSFIGTISQYNIMIMTSF